MFPITLLVRVYGLPEKAKGRDELEEKIKKGISRKTFEYDDGSGGTSERICVKIDFVHSYPTKGDNWLVYAETSIIKHRLTKIKQKNIAPILQSIGAILLTYTLNIFFPRYTNINILPPKIANEDECYIVTSDT